MKRLLVAITLAGTLAAPVLAQDKMAADPSCTDYMAMSSEERMKAMEMMGTKMHSDSMGDAMSAEEMSPGDMMGSAMEACGAHPDAMVGEAMEMMKGG